MGEQLTSQRFCKEKNIKNTTTCLWGFNGGEAANYSRIFGFRGGSLNLLPRASE